ncbi:MAG: ABC transporter substrate-binding protein [Planctomycetota bacterium]
MLLWLGLVSCGEPRPVTYTDQQLRIVSLAPAITHVLIELGLQDAIVAVGDYDDLAPVNTPSLGRFIDLDLEQLTTLAPTHVLAMTGQAKLPQRVYQMADQGRFVLADTPYPGNVEQVMDSIQQIGQALGREERTSQMVREMRYQLDAFSELTADRERPSALMLFSLDPIYASAPNTVNGELLRIAGGRNVVVETKVTAPVYDREALRALAPEVIFLMLPGDPPLDGPDDPRLDSLRGLGLPAVENGRVYLLNDPTIVHAGPSVVTTAVSMAVALHPDLAEPIAEVFRESP